MQIWEIDINNFFTGNSYFTKEPSNNEITTPITIGHIKPKWNGSEWVEGATEQEVQEWKNNQIVEYEPSLEDYMLDLDFRLSMIELGLKGGIRK